MSELTDQNIERLSHLFASGSLRHAREIARLLGQEIPEQQPERQGVGQGFGQGSGLISRMLVSRLLAASALDKQDA
jgi:hypothetical protein